MHYSVLAVVTYENLDTNLRQQSAKVPANTITGEEGNFLTSPEVLCVSVCVVVSYDGVCVFIVVKY